MATTIEEETPVGTLMEDIFDTPSQKLIWRGIASGTLTGKPEKDEKKMDKAVTEFTAPVRLGSPPLFTLPRKASRLS